LESTKEEVKKERDNMREELQKTKEKFAKEKTCEQEQLEQTFDVKRAQKRKTPN